MKFELFYPQWKDQAVTFSYDDGQIFDRRLVDIFNKYNLKATFHLNSGTLDTEGFIKTQELKSLYQDMKLPVMVLHMSIPHIFRRKDWFRNFIRTDAVWREKREGLSGDALMHLENMTKGSSIL